MTLAYSGSAFSNGAQFRAGAGIYRLSETTPTVLSYVAQPALDTVADTARFCASASGRYVVARPEACAVAASASYHVSWYPNETSGECYADGPAIFEEGATVVPWRSASELPATIRLSGHPHKGAVAWVLWGAPGEAQSLVVTARAMVPLSLRVNAPACRFG